MTSIRVESYFHHPCCDCGRRCGSGEKYVRQQDNSVVHIFCSTCWNERDTAKQAGKIPKPIGHHKPTPVESRKSQEGLTEL